MRAVVVLAMSVVLGVVAAGCGPCTETAERSLSVPVLGATSVRIIAGAGSLEVNGRAGLTKVFANGTACARDTDDLEELQFVTRTSGGEIVIEARTEPLNSEFDFVVEIPDSLLVNIDDGSGNIVVRNVAEVVFSDGSGNIDVNGVSGDVVVEDDGSGDISVSDVDGSFHVASDGSGSISARDIRGDFTVDEAGSGDIEYSNVGGDVRIPRD